MRDLIFLAVAVALVYFVAMYWVNIPWPFAAVIAIAGTVYAGSERN